MKNTKLSAQASLAVLVVLVIVMISVAALVSELSVTGYKNQGDSIKSNTALLLVDSGLEEAIYRLHEDANYSGGAFDTPEGSVNIVVNTIDSTSREVVVTTTTTPVQRTLTATVSVTTNGNPLQEFAIFGGDDVDLIKDSAMLVGTLWSNDNVNLDSSTTVVGNVYAAGAGNGSKSRVRNGARIEDDPATLEIEGNIYSIDDLDIINSGYVENDAVSKDDVRVSSGGFAGNIIEDPSLEIETIEIPVFDFDEYEAVAQTAGTRYNSPAAFLSYLSLNAGNISGGIHFIDSTSTLNIPLGIYNISGTIISRGSINISANSYTHNTDSDLPALLSKRDINFLDSTPCNCTATVNGAVFAERSIQLKHDQYNGPGVHAVDITGVLWAGDQVTIEDHSKLTFDPDIASAAVGFNFGTGSPTTNNIVQVLGWSIE